MPQLRLLLLLLMHPKAMLLLVPKLSRDGCGTKVSQFICIYLVDIFANIFQDPDGTVDQATFDTWKLAIIEEHQSSTATGRYITRAVMPTATENAYKLVTEFEVKPLSERFDEHREAVKAQAEAEGSGHYTWINFNGLDVNTRAFLKAIWISVRVIGDKEYSMLMPALDSKDQASFYEATIHKWIQKGFSEC